MEMQKLPSLVNSFPRSSSSLRAYDKLHHGTPHRDFPTPEGDDGSGRKRRNRCALASVCCILAVVAAVTLGTVIAVRARNGHASSSSEQQQLIGTAAIAAACNATTYPDLCYQWLSSDPNAKDANPVKLVDLGIKVAFNHVDEASALALELFKNPNITNFTKQAIEDCLELMDLSHDQLNDSMHTLGSITFASLKPSLKQVKRSLSGTMGFHLACSEGLFDLKSNGSSLSVLVESQEKVSKAVIISLDLADTLFSTFGGDLSSWKDSLPKVHLRRLLSTMPINNSEQEFSAHDLSLDKDGFPEWLSADDRRILQATPPTTTPPVQPSSSPPVTHSPPQSPPATQSPPPQPPPATQSPPPQPAPATPLTPPVTTPSAAPKPPISSSPSTPSVPAPTGSAYDAIVAQDGSGNYKSVTEALNNVPKGRSSRYTIYIKKGEYNEYLNIPKGMNLLTLIGDGMGQTIITGDKSFSQGVTTYKTATVAISGPNFIARKITFRNTAGAENHQAVALRVNSDQAVFDSCSFEGYQDTLYALANRQFYTGCTISGTVDFIFGNAIAVFQDCNVLGRLPLQTQRNTFTAQGRKVSSDPSGYSFQKCTVGAAPDLQSPPYPIESYFGRPWKAYSRTVFMQCTIQQVINPAGWLPWDATNPFTDTLYYGEYQNTGAGADTSKRVAWKGVHPNMSPEEASAFTVNSFISGPSWIQEANVVFQPSL
ncbi:hypothetical protein KP509_19G055400 [Ceratopteris richardii]|uniref:Pectinesterase n=1 Tax=Ceratopteris richardii TaxID=49495 RepID=A0A8T2SLC5_CERRI|nr:hypothetical protein KP509_19G055400 [Ceratopteris richardii]